MARMDGKVAIITGAARGIGAAAAKLFVAEGARVMLVDILEEPLAALASEIGADKAAYQVADVSDEAQTKLYVAQTVARFGGVDAVLLNAGIEGAVTPTVDYPTDVFDKVIAINVRGVWLGLKYAMQAMASKGGSIVVTSSTAGIRSLPNISAYTASKHAVIGLMRSAALEGAANDIRVNTVNPSPIDTDMMQAMEDKVGVPAAERSNRPLAQSTPLKRYGEPEEVAQMMLFLASDDSSFCTGGVYMVDGGVSAGRV
ncbi:MAG: SDR family NAD(P)-dependent oxidoreductase [Alphaproteobacteria bacterium]|jgi:NAD(P)-dependent dehydrogenase (short-subunit alcohol dehydrogenase family)